MVVGTELTVGAADTVGEIVGDGVVVGTNDIDGVLVGIVLGVIDGVLDDGNNVGELDGKSSMLGLVDGVGKIGDIG